jgi:SHS2 domain-containing protein
VIVTAGIVMKKTSDDRFRILEHEADVGFEAYGWDQEELFANAAYALFSLITDPETVRTGVTKHITINNGEELLVVFLNELLYLWDTKRFIPGHFSIAVKEGRLEAEIAGETLDPDRHPVHKEVKAVTYHKFTIQKEGERLKATIFLDI